MSKISKNQIASLVELQKIEIETGRIKKKIGRVDQRIEALDKQLADYKQMIEGQESLIKELNQKYRAYESDVQMNLDRIKKSEAKLNTVKTNKEYQSSLKEIDDLKEINSKVEDEMIEFLDRIDAAENDLKIKTAEYSKLEAQMNTEKETIRREAEAAGQKLGQFDAEWKTVSDSIDAVLLAQFKQIQENQENNIGIVAAKDAVCQGCHMNIPPQMYNELQRGDSLKRCPICQRIIYWEEKTKRSE